MNDQTPAFGWGHINVNVSDLDHSIAFYEKLGFSVFLPSIPYLGMATDAARAIPEASAQALGLKPGTGGRACIMQLDDGFPKLDLTELDTREPRSPLSNGDTGVVRICLFAPDLASAYAHLCAAGVEFITPPSECVDRRADIAVCRDPDGTLIELIQAYLENWPELSAGAD